MSDGQSSRTLGVQFRCPACNKAMQTEATAIGKAIKCPNCAAPVVVPMPKKSKLLPIPKKSKLPPPPPPVDTETDIPPMKDFPSHPAGSTIERRRTQGDSNFAFGISFFVVLTFGIIGVLCDRHQTNTHIGAHLNVELLDVKRVGGKWRYFFRVTNKGKDTFRDSVTIQLKRKDGGTTWYETFDFDKVFIEPNVSKVVFTDVHTGMTEDYGEYKITNFSYEIE